MADVNAWKRRIITQFQKRVLNPLTTRLPSQTLLETVGRSSGQPRVTPIGGRRTGNQFWLVAEHGGQSNYIRNIRANNAVRLRLHGTWHTGTATVLPDDDAVARLAQLPRLNSAAVRAVGTDLLTVRIDLTD
ncbi:MULTISPECIES: nitroreductase/quinone reductase family protein [Rhodococcus]|uniref:Nitroreductase/quinone reductase family protein n=1 Tax=Rhodococcus oxybenzonivorans TaxID=1990687 RepID=A0AAE5A8D1_9NOCA|nr:MULTISPECIES: nitroreductase/quinone reductase family protein [Rhodococcus]MDV7245192.1 nitroreductase/quinone reductase family protein [Rhodococcus oxybenzonivorans]MDV7267456.1 nitroreductase/quinone reductase family protein [Rhodococcus oxybenzonivorans]MDV7272526.1 nitroreductase/quinone reductase family protein [Rhodococcus oxybenzonivorans]MDV7336217.1 nitroreductase/quinone reductase family protein [Rhodococcus oxybenzonivorans]MDV7342902.1 nitroreductase/quinone reductase family pro